MKVFNFHLMPYRHADLDAIERNGSAWVTFSNRHYEPDKGAELYHEYLDQMELADRLGFDGVCLQRASSNTPIGMMPYPAVLAARSLRHTPSKPSRSASSIWSKIFVIEFGNPCPARNVDWRRSPGRTVLLNGIQGRRGDKASGGSEDLHAAALMPLMKLWSSETKTDGFSTCGTCRTLERLRLSIPDINRLPGERIILGEQLVVGAPHQQGGTSIRCSHLCRLGS